MFSPLEIIPTLLSLNRDLTLSFSGKSWIIVKDGIASMHKLMLDRNFTIELGPITRCQVRIIEFYDHGHEMMTFLFQSEIWNSYHIVRLYPGVKGCHGYLSNFLNTKQQVELYLDREVASEYIQHYRSQLEPGRLRIFIGGIVVDRNYQPLNPREVYQDCQYCLGEVDVSVIKIIT